MLSYRGIVLCAGVSERLRPLTYDTNKSLLEINGKSLIEHWLDSLIYSEAPVDTVHIIVGHYGYKFRQLLGSKYGNLKIQFLENALYKITGAAQSLYTASHILRKHPCIIVEGDHYVDPQLMHKLMHSEFENCILVDTDLARLKYDEEVVAYGYGGTLNSLKWLPPYPSHPLGEALTIFKLSKEASSALATILEVYLLEDGSAKKEIIEPFNKLAKCYDLHYVDTENRKWVEVDFMEDLEEARRIRFEA